MTLGVVTAVERLSTFYPIHHRLSTPYVSLTDSNVALLMGPTHDAEDERIRKPALAD